MISVEVVVAGVVEVAGVDVVVEVVVVVAEPVLTFSSVTSVPFFTTTPSFPPSFFLPESGTEDALSLGKCSKLCFSRLLVPGVESDELLEPEE